MTLKFKAPQTHINKKWEPVRRGARPLECTRHGAPAQQESRYHYVTNGYANS